MPDTVELFGMTFSDVTFEELCTLLADRIDKKLPGYIVTPNVDHVCQVQSDPAFRQAYDDAWLVLVDGMPIIWASRLFGCALSTKLSGSDLLPQLCEFAADRGYSVFLLGAAEGVADQASENLRRLYPGLIIAGTHSPPMGFDQDPDENAKALQAIREARPDLCFTAMGAPRQEVWLHSNHRESGALVSIGVGAALDFAAGLLKRAPLWMQRSGLEWVWRLCQEPRRLWRRYLVNDSFFFVLLWREWRKRLRRDRTEGPD